MMIKTKKRGEIEIGGDDELGKALSKWLGPVLDETLDIIARNTTIWLSPDDDVEIYVDVGGEADCIDDLITVTLEKLIGDAVSHADKGERDNVRKKLRAIADRIK